MLPLDVQRIHLPYHEPLKYEACASPAGATGGSWTMKGKERETCLNGPALDVNMTRLKATEQSVDDWCARTNKIGRCKSILDIVLALTAPFRRRHGPHDDLRCAARAPIEHFEGHMVVNLVFLGDSISLRTLNAAACDLHAHGLLQARIPRDYRHGRTYHRVHAHPAFATVHKLLNAKYGEHKDLETITERTFVLPLELVTAAHPPLEQVRASADANNANKSGEEIVIRLVGLWRSGSTLHGPGMVGEPGIPSTIFEDLMASFGSCTAVIYNEGLVRRRPPPPPRAR